MVLGRLEQSCLRSLVQRATILHPVRAPRRMPFSVRQSVIVPEVPVRRKFHRTSAFQATFVLLELQLVSAWMEHLAQESIWSTARN